MPICLICSESFPNHYVVDGKRRNLQNRKYCLNCSPFGEHNTKQIHQVSKLRNSTCLICHKVYVGTGNRCGYCCVKIRRARLKLAGIKMLGGCCNRCGYNESPWVLEFHHQDQNKDFGISETQNISWEKLKKEMLKCELLCANCHRLEHCTKSEDHFLKAVFDYDGDLDFK